MSDIVRESQVYIYTLLITNVKRLTTLFTSLISLIYYKKRLLSSIFD